MVAEARAFMAGYAADLLAGNREAIIARYDRRGAWFPGDKTPFYSFDQVGALYRGEGWSKPTSFEWTGLAFDPIGADTVAVIGGFTWQGVTFSYSAVLVRQDGVLRIRMEHEAPQSR